MTQEIRPSAEYEINFNLNKLVRPGHIEETVQQPVLKRREPVGPGQNVSAGDGNIEVPCVADSLPVSRRRVGLNPIRSFSMFN